MATFLPAKHGVEMSAAIAEAYAVAPTDVTIYHTLEMRHSTFLDADGNITAVRVVRDVEDNEFGLEDDAPLNSGETVPFVGLIFDFTPPPEGESGSVPEIQITMDNVGQILISKLDNAVQSPTRESIQVTYRPYLSTDKTEPHINPPITMTIRSVDVDMQRVTATASFGDLPNRKFPSMMYLPKDFAGLTSK